jgi:hypothetical protein
MKLFHWGLILRYMVYGVLPLIVLLVVAERGISAGSIGAGFVMLALALPFVAVGWLAWQHWRHRKQK